MGYGGLGNGLLGLGVIFWIVFIIVWCLICPILSASIASKKGYSGGGWFAISFFFGIIGLIAATGLPDRKIQDSLERITQILLQSQTIQIVDNTNLKPLAQTEKSDEIKEGMVEIFCPKCKKRNIVQKGITGIYCENCGKRIV